MLNWACKGREWSVETKKEASAHRQKRMSRHQLEGRVGYFWESIKYWWLLVRRDFGD